MAGRAWTYWPAHIAPVPLDVVWCAFPFQDTEEVKERPGLVRSIQFYANHTRLIIEVTYGTSRLKAGQRDHDLVVANNEEMAAAGLPQATRFDLDRCIRLPWAKEVFVCRLGDKTPIVGHLHARTQRQLEFLKAIRERHRQVAREQFRPDDNED